MATALTLELETASLSSLVHSLKSKNPATRTRWVGGRVGMDCHVDPMRVGGWMLIVLNPSQHMPSIDHHDDDRAAKDLRTLVESASRGLSIETFAKFEHDLFQVRAPPPCARRRRRPRACRTAAFFRRIDC